MYSLFDAKVKGIAYEGVADADLVHPGYLLVEEGQILERKVVAGIEAKSAVAGNFGSLDKRLYRLERRHLSGNSGFMVF